MVLYISVNNISPYTSSLHLKHHAVKCVFKSVPRAPVLALVTTTSLSLFHNFLASLLSPSPLSLPPLAARVVFLKHSLSFLNLLHIRAPQIHCNGFQSWNRSLSKDGLPQKRTKANQYYLTSKSWVVVVVGDHVFEFCHIGVVWGLLLILACPEMQKQCEYWKGHKRGWTSIMESKETKSHTVGNNASIDFPCQQNCLFRGRWSRIYTRWRKLSTLVLRLLKALEN